jgi:flagellar biogenesis protein FliO
VHPFLAAVLLLATDGLPAPASQSAAQPRAATSPAPPALRLPAGPGLGSLAVPAVVLAGLGAAAALLSRRRRAAPGRRVQVLETTALGPRRSLILARLGGELLLLGSSEAGISLLRAQPAGAEAPDAELPRPAAAAAPRSAHDREPPAALAGLVAKLRRVRPAAPAFDTLLAESAEDQELRRKLARGQSGSVR